MKQAGRIVVLFLLLPLLLTAQKTIEQLRTNPGEFITHIRGLYERNFYDMALEECDRFLAQYPKDKSAMEVKEYQLNCLFHLHKHDLLLQKINAFLKQYPQTKQKTNILKLAALTHQELKHFAEAEKFWIQLAKSPQKETEEEALYQIAKCRQGRGDTARAMQELKKLADRPLDEKYPLRPYAMNEYALILYMNGEYLQALPYCMRLFQSHLVSADFREKALYEAADISRHLGRTQDTMNFIAQYEIHFPHGNFVTEIQKIHIDTLRKMQRWSEILPLCKQWLDAHPNKRDCQIDLIYAEALTQNGKYQEALAFYLRCEEDPQFPSATRQQAAIQSIQCLFMNGKHTEAETKAEEFLQKYPRSLQKGNALLLLSHIQKSLNKQQEAMETMQQALPYFADNPEELERNLLYLIELYKSASKWPEMADCYRQLAKYSPPNKKGPFYLYAGNCERKCKNISQAKKDYLEATKDKISEISAWQSLGDLAIGEQNWNEALLAMKHLVQIQPIPQRYTTILQMATIYERMGQFEEGILRLQESLKDSEIPPNISCRFEMVMLLLYMKQNSPPEDAYALLQKILGKKEYLPYMEPMELHYYATVCQQHGRPELAIHARETLLKLPQAKPVIRCRSNYALAELYVQKGNLTRAQELLNQIDATPSHDVLKCRLFSLKGEILCLQQKYREAQDTLLRALLQQEDDTHANTRALFYLAKIAFEQEKKPQEANRLATKCYILYNDAEYTPRAMELSIRYFRKIGRQKDADSLLRDLRKKFPAYSATSSL